MVKNKSARPTFRDGTHWLCQPCALLYCDDHAWCDCHVQQKFDVIRWNFVIREEHQRGGKHVVLDSSLELLQDR